MKKFIIKTQDIVGYDNVVMANTKEEAKEKFYNGEVLERKETFVEKEGITEINEIRAEEFINELQRMNIKKDNLYYIEILIEDSDDIPEDCSNGRILLSKRFKDISLDHFLKIVFDKTSDFVNPENLFKTLNYSVRNNGISIDGDTVLPNGHVASIFMEIRKFD